MNLRQPARAGSFYENTAASCRHHAQRLLDEAGEPGVAVSPAFGGLVPHAGWMFSGRLAAKTLKALLSSGPPTSIVLFGADHTGAARCGEVFDSGAWRTPLGDAPIDNELAAAILAAGGETLRANPKAHDFEHSLEVQVPIIQMLAPQAAIVPITVPPATLAIEVGRIVGGVLRERSGGVPVVGSTDLTHHGGHFPAPGGRGEDGVQWTESNDRRILALIEAMDAPGAIAEAEENGNACGAGAIAATIEACRALGARSGRTLDYTNSYRVVHARYPYDPDDTTVGYASVVFV